MLTAVVMLRAPLLTAWHSADVLTNQFREYLSVRSYIMCVHCSYMHLFLHNAGLCMSACMQVCVL